MVIAMASTFECPNCKRELKLPDELVGKKVKCPACQTIFMTTAEAGPQAGSTPAAPDLGEGQPTAPLEDLPREPRPRKQANHWSEEEEDDYEPGPVRSPRRRRYSVEHRGAMILTLGILSLVICGFLGPVAWVMGNNDLSAMRAGRMDPAGQGLTQAGRILGIIATIWMIVGFVLMCVYFAFFAALAGAGKGFK
jgi:hypothetical protein